MFTIGGLVGCNVAILLPRIELRHGYFVRAYLRFRQVLWMFNRVRLAQDTPKCIVFAKTNLSVVQMLLNKKQPDRAYLGEIDQSGPVY